MRKQPTEEYIKQVLADAKINKRIMDLEIEELKRKHYPYNLRQAGELLGVSHEWARHLKNKFSLDKTLDNDVN